MSFSPPNNTGSSTTSHRRRLVSPPNPNVRLLDHSLGFSPTSMSSNPFSLTSSNEDNNNDIHLIGGDSIGSPTSCYSINGSQASSSTFLEQKAPSPSSIFDACVPIPPLSTQSRQPLTLAPTNQVSPSPTSKKSSNDISINKLKQQRTLIFLLRHAAKCQYDENCPVTKHCKTMKKVWAHLKGCTIKDCGYPICVSSRKALTHYSKCRDRRCFMCAPVRRKVKEERIQRKYDSATASNNSNNIGSRNIHEPNPHDNIKNMQIPISMNNAHQKQRDEAMGQIRIENDCDKMSCQAQSNHLPDSCTKQNNIEFNGDWRSDVDIDCRRQMINHILDLLKQENLSQEELRERVIGLEEALYCSASSLEEYADYETLKIRLTEIICQQVGP